MNLEQMKARLAAIVAQLETLKGQDLTDENVESINALSGEFDTLQNKIEATEKLDAISAKANASARQVPAQATTPRVEVQASLKEKNGGFNSMGEFLTSVRNAAMGDIDKRFKNAMFEKTGEDGGFLVPDTMLSEVQKKLSSEESLLAKTRQFVVSGNTLTLPVDEKTPWTNGVTAYWTAEGATITGSKPAIPGFKHFRLHKLAALIPTSDELLEDATALESYIKAAAPEAMMHKINESILTGNGVGKPHGILNSGFKVQVAKEVGQSADTVVAKNIIKMYSRLLPNSRSKAVWYINPMVEEQLRMMKDDNNNYIYLAPGSQMNQSVYGLLLGLPVLPLLGGMPQLGDEGDIVLADLSFFYTVIKSSGIKNAVSTHLLFDKDQTAYKFTFRIDGACPFSAPVSPQYGTYNMSGIITLEAR